MSKTDRAGFRRLLEQAPLHALLLLLLTVAGEAAAGAPETGVEVDIESVPVIRPRQEGRFEVQVGPPKRTATRVVGTLAGRQLLEIDSPVQAGNMGKLMVEDNEGYVWFLETREDKAVKIDPKTLEMTEYYLPRGGGPYSHAIDSQGVHWITAHGIEMLFEFDPKKLEVISHAAPSFGFLIHVNVDRRDDTIYLCQPGANLILSYHRERGFREYRIPTPSAGPGRLDIDAQGNIWFPELYADKLAKLDPRSGEFEEWDLPIKHGTPSFARVDDEGVVWVSLPMGDHILRFENGVFRKYEIPTSGSMVSTTVTDAEGYIWFTEGGWRGSSGGNKVGRLDPRTGKVIEMAIPTPNAQPLGIILDRQGTMWFEQMNAGKIGRLGRPLAQMAKQAEDEQPAASSEGQPGSGSLP